MEKPIRAPPKKKAKTEDEDAVESSHQLEWEQLQESIKGNTLRPQDLPELEEWDHTKLPEGFFMVLEGKRRTGKSTFVKWLLQYYQDWFALAWCMTNTKASGYWQEIVGEAYTFDGWYPQAIEELIERNDKIIKKYGKDSPETMKLAHTVIILDDIISSKIHDDATFIRLAVEGRHHKICVILMTQDPKAIGPKIRDNCDVAIIFNQKTHRNKESIWHDFMNDTKRELAYAMLDKWAVRHDCLISNQTHLEGKITSEFFKSTIDKTKLQDEHYTLGGQVQKRVIEEERKVSVKDKEKQKALRGQAKENPQEVRKLSAKEILK